MMTRLLTNAQGWHNCHSSQQLSKKYQATECHDKQLPMPAQVWKSSFEFASTLLI
jgi:hypothetical protein